MVKHFVIVILFVTCWTRPALPAHPLITDDTGTQGKGRVQFEFIGEYQKDKEKGGIEESFVMPIIPVFSYGINDSLDLVLGIPFDAVKTEHQGTTSRVHGIGDTSIELKARLYEKKELSIAVKPGVSLPTGNEEKGLGNGMISYSAFFITTRQIAPWAFHFNLGYVRNEYKLEADEDANRKDIWHVSIASELEVVKKVKAVANIGMQSNSDKAASRYPAFLLGGFICSVTENLDVDFGVRRELNRPETDIRYLAGITWRL